jgi:hypothetical protein
MAKRPINYTSRDFESIKSDLENYAKRYYPSTFKDFSEASFGALMLDLVAYVGDQLSFYADFQTNESFLDSAIRYDSVVRLAETLGFKHKGAGNSTGTVSFYMLVPVAVNSRAPDLNYFPILQKGAILTGDNGATFTLIDDVDFRHGNNEITVARTDNTTGNPTYFAVKAYGQVVSGEQFQERLDVTNYQRFLRLPLSKQNITEVMSVVDSQGHEYYEVEHLSQDAVLSQIKNVDSTTTAAVPYLMKTKPVPRRFITQHTPAGETFIQFGYGSSDNITGDIIADPADVVLNVNSKPYVTDDTFDPTNLIKSDKFGVVPVNTTLTVTYNANTNTVANASVGAVSNIVAPNLLFDNRESLDASVVNVMFGSLEVENESPILGDMERLSAEEIKQRAFGTFSAQNRAVTREDYINLIYRMPGKYGKIKRVNVMRDADSFKRNLNLYILAEGATGNFSSPNSVLKNNVKVWLDKYKMINDTIDILDGRIINIGIRYKVIPDLGANKFDLLSDCTQKIQDYYINIKFNLGEPLYLNDIYKLLNEVPGVVDTTHVEFFNLSGGSYSNYIYDIDSHISRDGRYLIIPQDSAAEILFPDTDIVGVMA